MGLPATGELKLSEINTELGFVAGASNSSFRARSNTAGKSTPDLFSDFHDFEKIALSFGSTNIIYDSASLIDYYKRIGHTNHTYPQVITINLDYYGSGNTNCSGYLYYRKNSDSWSTLTQFPPTVNSSTTISSVGYGDTVDVRIKLSTGSGYLLRGEWEITGGSVTTGNGIASGTATWSESLGEDPP